MAQTKTYKTTALVLRKTKLGERDLIVTLLAETGALIKCVAKGARKPGSSFAAKLELFTCVDILAARGRNLDVITEARFSKGSHHNAFGLEQSACAACVSELLGQICQEDLEHPRLFAMAKAAFECFGKADPIQAVLLLNSSLLKIISSAGFKPSFERCPICGNSNDLEIPNSKLLFIVGEGGVICPRCQSDVEGWGIPIAASTISWAHALLYAKFSDIASYDADLKTAFDVLEIVRPWVEFYAGKRLKSIDYLMSSGMF